MCMIFVDYLGGDKPVHSILNSVTKYDGIKMYYYLSRDHPRTGKPFLSLENRANKGDSLITLFLLVFTAYILVYMHDPKRIE